VARYSLRDRPLLGLHARRACMEDLGRQLKPRHHSGTANSTAPRPGVTLILSPKKESLAMARSKRCPNCGLVQMASSQCKKCGAPMEGVGSPGVAPPRPPAHHAPPVVANANPYAPPSAPGAADFAGRQGGVWQEGRILVAAQNAVLPNRCVKCNDVAADKLKRTFYWHPPAWYLLILINIIVYAIVAAIIRKKAILEVGLCDRHRSRRMIGLILSGLIPFIAFGGCVVSGASEGWMAFGWVSFLLALVCLVVANVLPRAIYIDEHLTRLKGVNADYLAQLPPYGQPYA